MKQEEFFNHIKAQGMSIGDWMTKHAEAEREAKAQQDARLRDANA